MPKTYRPVVQRMAPAHSRPGLLRHSLAVACQWAVNVGVAIAGVFYGGGHFDQGPFGYLRSNGCSWPAIISAYVLLSCVLVVPLVALI